MNEVFANCSKEDKIYPLTTEEIAEAQPADASLKHLFTSLGVIRVWAVTKKLALVLFW